MSKSRDIADSAATINYIDNVTSDVQSQLNTLTTAIDNVSVTSGTLTKTFTQNESSTINLTDSVLAPMVSVTKEVSQSGATNNYWDSDAATYQIEDSAYDTTLSFSGGNLALGTGSFSSDDVGKTITVNDGVLVLTATDGSYQINTPTSSNNQAASGEWTMKAVVYNATDDVLELSGEVNGFSPKINSYDEIRFSVFKQETSPTDLFFSTDGLKLFIVGFASDSVHEYKLTEPFNITAPKFIQSFSVASEDTNPQSLAFNPSGTKMFVLGDTGNDVNEYDLSTGFDISTASFSQNYSVNSDDGSVRSIKFNTDGSKMFILGASGQTVGEHSLSTGFDISTAVFTRDFSVIRATTQGGLAFNTDGTKMFVSGSSLEEVAIYKLTTGFDLSTASHVRDVRVFQNEVEEIKGIAFNSDGSKLFMLTPDYPDGVYQYSSQDGRYAISGDHPVFGSKIDTTYWTDINSLTATDDIGLGYVSYAISTDNRDTWSVLDNTDGVRDIVRNNAGTWQYNSNTTYTSETWTAASTNSEVSALQEAMEVSLDAAINISEIVDTDAEFYFGSQDTATEGIAFNNDGTKLYYAGDTNDNVYQYSLSTAYDVSTASYDSVLLSLNAVSTSPRGIRFNNDGTKLFVSLALNAIVAEYGLSTAYDLSTASHNGSFSYQSQDGSGAGIAFNNDGSKMYLCGLSTSLIYEYDLSTNFVITTASYNSVSFNDSDVAGGALDIEFSSDGTQMFLVDSGGTIYQYSLSTAFDLSTASYDSISFGTGVNTLKKFAFSSDRSYIVFLGDGVNSAYLFSVKNKTFVNQMSSTQLNAITDANQVTLTDDLDFVTILGGMEVGTKIPNYSGTEINYDANVLNKGAVLGTDYDFDAPAQNKARITALTAGNFKVRVV